MAVHFLPMMYPTPFDSLTCEKLYSCLLLLVMFTPWCKSFPQVSAKPFAQCPIDKPEDWGQYLRNSQLVGQDKGE